MKERSPTTFRFTAEDLEILERLQKATGLSAVAAVRLAIRESLAVHERRSKR